jgi:Spy/CpxP family protein refolding chaperone
MRRLVAVATTAVLSLAGGWALAGPPETKDPQVVTPPRSVERIRDLNLTDAQEAAIAGIREEYAPRIDEAVAELNAVVKEEIDQARAVLTPEQREQLAAMKQERKVWRMEGVVQRYAHLSALDLTDEEMNKIADIRKEYRPRIVKALEGLKGILTPEQAELREEALKAGKPRREVLASLKLTDDQKTKVEAVGNEVRTLVREELDKVRAVLTPEQQVKLAVMKEERKDRVRDRVVFDIVNYKELKLTDEQKGRIEAIRTEYRPRVETAGNQLRALVREEIAAIITVVKT